MAIVRVQEAFQAFGIFSSGSVTISPSGSGNFLLVMVLNTSSVTVSTVVDNAGNSYAVVAGAQGVSGTNLIANSWYVNNCNSGATLVTVTLSGGASSGKIYVVEYSGVSSSSPFDSSGGTGNPSGTCISPTLFTSTTEDVLVTASIPGSANYTSVTAPWTTVEASNSGALGEYFSGSGGSSNTIFNPTPQPYAATGVGLHPASPSGITFRQERRSSVIGSSTSVSIAASGSGNLIVVMLAYTSASLSPISVSDGVNTYIQAAGGTATNSIYTVSTWYAYNSVAGATSVSVSIPTSTNLVVSVQEFTGTGSSDPLVTANTLLNSSGTDVGPTLLPTNTGQLLVSLIMSTDETSFGAQSPWAGIAIPNYGGDAFYINPPVSSQQVQFTPVAVVNYGATGAVFAPANATLTLNLSDSHSASDSMADSFSIPLSDSASASDTAPNSFSVQSSFLAPVVTPIVETLTNQLLPADTKVYYRIQE